MRRVRVAVLMGGPSPERDVSLATGSQIVTALDPRRYDVLPVEITTEGRWLPRPDLKPLTAGTRDQGPGTRSTPNPGFPAAPGSRLAAATVSGPLAIDEAVNREAVDVVFIAMHGPYGEDGTVQGLLELLGVAYTGSGVLASALGMDKLRSRQLFEWHRIPVPAYLSVRADRGGDRTDLHQQVGRHLGFPCVVKPNAGGSSIGVSLVYDSAGLDPAIEAASAYGPVVLIEEYVRGTEITCGLIDDPDTGEPVTLPLVEIVPHAEFYDYEAKYAAGGSDHMIPARVTPEVAARAEALALRAYKALGCEGMSRVDMIARGEDLVVLEVNTIPGMTPTSLLPDAAKAAGVEFPELLDRIVRSALRRTEARGLPRGSAPRND